VLFYREQTSKVVSKASLKNKFAVTLLVHPKSCLLKKKDFIGSISLILTRKITEIEQNKNFTYRPTRCKNPG
jgi:hypothetical protein